MSKIFNKKVVYSLYAVALCSLLVGLITLSGNEKKVSFESPSGVIDILSKINLPVMKESDTVIGRPYNNEEVKIVQNYYDYQGEEKDQTSSIIYYQDTYIQSSGVSYSLGEETFDVLSVLDGEVIEVTEDTLLGNTIKIKHSESVVSVYQSVNDIQVKEGDIVKKGDKIAVSATSNINSSLNNHLYFELLIDDVNVNPEEYYDKSL